MHVLIVKRGALGDVVRTSYFARALKVKFGPNLRLSWITATASLDLLRLNTSIDDLWTDFFAAETFHFDHVFSLDDERDALEGVARLKAKLISGAVLDGGEPSYTPDAAGWFDMGLLSRFGKQRADEIKRVNERSHAQIFSDIFGVEHVEPHFYLDDASAHWAEGNLPKIGRLVGINPYSGGRWPSKELLRPELSILVENLLKPESPLGADVGIVLLGAGADFARNSSVIDEIGNPRVLTVNTDASVQHLAAVIARLDYLVSSDSLALHLAIAQDIPFTAFFSPTSAAEIDDWGIGTKVISTAADYCSYRKDADNSSITALRIIKAIRDNPRIQTLRP